MTLEHQISNGLRWSIAAHYNTTARERWEELAGSGDLKWPDLVKEAIHSGLGPLLFASVKRLATHDVPTQIYSELTRSYYDSATQNLLVIEELTRIDDLLKRNCIAFIVLKGPAFLDNGYGSFALRPMGDLDLLVAFEDVAKTKAVLEEAGYNELSPFPFVDDSGLCFNEMSMIRQNAPPVVIEIHWHLLNNPYFARKLPTAELFSRSTVITIDQIRFRALSPADQLFHLSCHHLFHHQRELIRTGPDIAFLINEHADTLNWAKIKQYAESNNLVWPLKSALVEAAELWFAQVPVEVIEELSNHQASTLERFFLASQSSEFAKAFRTFTTLPGLRLKSRYILGQLFPRREYMAFRYGLRSSTPLLVAYIERYIGGARNLAKELFGSR